MKRFYTTIVCCCIFIFGANAQNIVGSWSGPIKLSSGDLRIIIHVSGTFGNYQATADIPDQNAYGLSLDTIMLDSDVIRFSIESMKVRYQGELIHPDSISGDFVQSGATFNLGLKRVGSAKIILEKLVERKDIKEDTTEEKSNKNVKQETVRKEDREGNEEVKNIDDDLTTKLQKLEPVLEQVLQKYNLAGYAVAVVNKSGIIYSRGFGYRDVESKKPVTPNTLFPIGSITKAFTAALVGNLADQKKVSLDSAARNYLPNLKFYTDELNNKVTLRDMMSHRTGLPRYDYSWYLFPTSSRDSLLARVKYMKPSVGFREKWQYNNFMYLAQGMVVEHLSGQSWEKNIEEVFFKPLSMKRSNTSISVMQQDVDASFGYTVVGDTLLKKIEYHTINAMGPAGSINSSVTELASWVKLWLNGGELDGSELLSKDYISDAVSSQMVMSPGIPKGKYKDINFSTYGLGWMLSSYRGHYQVAHGGNIDGFSSDVSFFPYDGLGVIVLSNQNSSSVPGLVRNVIVDHMFGLSNYGWIDSSRTALNVKEIDNLEDKVRVLGANRSHELKEYAGMAKHPAFGAINFYVKNDSLFAQFPDKVFWLKHYHYDVFEGKAMDKEHGVFEDTNGGIKFNFRTNIQGDISEVEIPSEIAIKEAQIFQFSRNVVLQDAELQKYAGVYTLSNQEIKVYIKDRNLFVSVPGQPDYKSTAVGNDRFKPDSLPGYMFSFDVDNNGEVIALYFAQPNGTFKAERK